jgi:hypothetical protein
VGCDSKHDGLTAAAASFHVCVVWDTENPAASNNERTVLTALLAAQVVLTMCKQQRLEPAILQLLKKSLVQGYEQQQRGRSRWLPSPAGGSGSGTTAGTTSSNSSNRPAAGGSLAAALLEAIR